MTKKTELRAKTREKTKSQVKNLRAAGKIPAVLYGPKTENKNLLLDRVAFQKTYEIAGESNLIDLILEDNQIHKVIIKDVQRDPVKNLFIHVDLYEVDMKKPIIVEVPLLFVGESKAEKELGGVLTKNLEVLEVECLPGDLVENIEIDLSSLSELGDSLHVKDIKIPNNLTLITPEDEMVVNVAEQKEEIEETSTEEKEETKEGEEPKAKEDDEKEEKEKEAN